MSRGRLSQNDRVLAALRRAGADGLDCSAFLMHPETVDGGPPIVRLPARIADLRAQGHRIATRRQPERAYARYVLVAVAPLLVDAPARSTFSVSDPKPVPIGQDVGGGPRSPYDPWGDAP